MKISLATKVVHGTDRGGEDLFLKMQFESEVEPGLLDEHDVKEALEEAWKSLPTGGDRETLESQRGVDLFSFEGKLCSRPTDYEFSVALSKEELEDFALDVFEEGDWTQTLKDKKYSISNDIYVDGNAD